jgi:nucleoside 2-deoxyribosyltransferase
VKLYLAMPMRGLPHHNYPAGRRAAAALRKAGYEVFSPVEHNEEKGITAEVAEKIGYNQDHLRQAMKQDLTWICDHADGIAYLDGASNSKGATAEMALGFAIDIPVMSVHLWRREKVRAKYVGSI